MNGTRWTGAEGVNVPALIICLLVVAAFAVLGAIWCRRPETRRRGMITLAVIIVPTLLAALSMSVRFYVGSQVR